MHRWHSSTITIVPVVESHVGNRDQAQEPIVITFDPVTWSGVPNTAELQVLSEIVCTIQHDRETDSATLTITYGGKSLIEPMTGLHPWAQVYRNNMSLALGTPTDIG